jgi:hypothetical protein
MDTLINRLTKAAIVAILFFQTGLAASALNPVDEAALRKAWGLYNQQKYAASADAFEAIIRVSAPNARLYYYAALANRESNRSARAKQMCDYIIANFGGTTEADYAQKLYPGAASKSSSGVDPLKGQNIQELMKTAEGRKIVQEALARKEAGAKASSNVSPLMAKSQGGKVGERVFTAGDIAKDGAGGIDQMYYPNCWFESSMSAVAMLPRGQKMMADMIRYGAKPGSFVVRFPGDGVEYTISEEDVERTGVHDKALWATLIECAQTKKFPDDAGGQLYEGLGYLTGRPAEQVFPGRASDEDLSAFIDGAVKSGNPIIAGTKYRISGLPRLVCSSHAYTIVGFEPARGMITIRNPHGANSERFNLPNDNGHQQFEQLNDGVFKMHISLFKQYFSEVARAFI